MRKIDYIVVHCTDSRDDATIVSLIAHWRSLGWKAPGYHYVVTRDGRLYSLASEDEVVNGVKGYNQNSIHIAYMGGRKHDGAESCTLNNKQQVTLYRELLNLQARYPQAKIVGHRDLSPDLDGNGVIESKEWVKRCPLFDVKTFVKSMKITNHGKV